MRQVLTSRKGQETRERRSSRDRAIPQVPRMPELAAPGPPHAHAPSAPHAPPPPASSVRSVPLDTTQIGAAGEQLFAAYLTLTSNGDLQLFRPLSDVDHTDISAGLRGRSPASRSRSRLLSS
jgi:hypothetical protein